MKKKIILLAATMCSIASWAPSVMAYNLEGPKQANIGDVKFQYADNDALKAAGDWEATPTKIYMNTNFTGTADITSGVSDVGNTGWSGQTTYQSDINGYFTSDNIVINTYYTSSYSSTEVEGVWGHELGHALGLAHNNSSTAILMYYSDARTVYTPQQDDIDGINALYP